MEPERDTKIKAISEEALDCIERVAGGAEEALLDYKGSDVKVLATINTWTDTKEASGIRKSVKPQRPRSENSRASR
jgi:hypothetical protein